MKPIIFNYSTDFTEWWDQIDLQLRREGLLGYVLTPEESTLSFSEPDPENWSDNQTWRVGRCKTTAIILSGLSDNIRRTFTKEEKDDPLILLGVLRKRYERSREGQAMVIRHRYAVKRCQEGEEEVIEYLEEMNNYRYMLKILGQEVLDVEHYRALVDGLKDGPYDFLRDLLLDSSDQSLDMLHNVLIASSMAYEAAQRKQRIFMMTKLEEEDKLRIEQVNGRVAKSPNEDPQRTRGRIKRTFRLRASK